MLVQSSAPPAAHVRPAEETEPRTIDLLTIRQKRKLRMLQERLTSEENRELRAEELKKPCRNCGGPGPVSKRLHFCRDCIEERKREYQHMELIVPVPAFALSFDDSQRALEAARLANCPLCGELIDDELHIGCWKHEAIILERAMRPKRIGGAK